MCSMRDGEGRSARELVETAVSALTALARQAPPDCPVTALELARDLGAGLDRGEAALAGLVGVADRAGEASAQAYAGTRGFLKVGLGMRIGRADERLLLARQLPRLERTEARFTSRSIEGVDRPVLSMGYASVICDALARLSDTDAVKGETILLEMVDRGCSVTQVARAGERILDLIAQRDGTEREPEDGARAERQWLRVSKSLGGGGFLKGRCGPRLMALIQERLGPLTRPAGPEDTRDHAERLADALEMYLSGGSTRWNATLVITLTYHHGSDPGGRDAGGTDGPPSSSRSGSGSATATNGTVDDGTHTSGGSEKRAGAAMTGTSAPHPSGDLAPREAGTSDGGTTGSGAGAGADTAGPGGAGADTAGRGGAGADTAGRGGAGGVDGAGHEGGGRHRERDFGQDRDGPDGAGLVGRGVEQTDGDHVESDGREGRHDGPRTGSPMPCWPLEPARNGWRVTARLADGTPVPLERARLIALNAGISPLLLDADGIPLYLGDKVRFITPAQRRVLEALYPTCAFDECDIPARFCEGDHVIGWTEKPATDIDVLAPCCAWHNRAKYRYADQITTTRDAQGRWVYTLHRDRLGHRTRRNRRARAP